MLSQAVVLSRVATHTETAVLSGHVDARRRSRRTWHRVHLWPRRHLGTLTCEIHTRIHENLIKSTLNALAGPHHWI